MTPRERNLDMIARIAVWHGCTAKDVLSRCRRRKQVAARKDCSRYLYEKTGNISHVASILNRDHTSIIYHLRGKARG